MNLRLTIRNKKIAMITQACIKAGDKGIDYSVMVSLVSLEFGAGRRYVKELIGDLINVNELKLSEDKLYYIG